MAVGLTLLMLGYLLIYAGIKGEHPWDLVTRGLSGKGD
jgi:hypothetical protein